MIVLAAVALAGFAIAILLPVRPFQPASTDAAGSAAAPGQLDTAV
jgi:hypothetical protein